MKKGLSKAKLQSPFREAKLMSLSSFISYCGDNGVRTSKEELESLNKQGLLFPIVKVYRGILKYKKIYAKFGESLEWRYVNPEDVNKFKPEKVERRYFYDSGGFHIGYDGWLDYYKKHKMVEYPAAQRYKKWESKKEAKTPFVADVNLIKNDYELFFDKTQLLNLKFIHKERDFWNFFDKAEQRKLIMQTKENLAKLINFLEFYIAVLEYFDAPNKILQKNVDGYIKQGLSEKDIDEALKEDYELDIKPLLKSEAKNLASEHSMSIDEIDHWRRLLSFHSVFKESNRSSKCIRTYLKSVDEDDIIRAEDTNYMVHVLNRFLLILTGENKTVKQIIESNWYPRCSVCGHEFNPSKFTQKTCGASKCISENKNRSKRKRK